VDILCLFYTLPRICASLDINLNINVNYVRVYGKVAQHWCVEAFSGSLPWIIFIVIVSTVFGEINFCLLFFSIVSTADEAVCTCETEMKQKRSRFCCFFSVLFHVCGRLKPKKCFIFVSHVRTVLQRQENVTVNFYNAHYKVRHFVCPADFTCPRLTQERQVVIRCVLSIATAF